MEGVVFDNDAKGCYDIMIISGIAPACMIRIGYSRIQSIWKNILLNPREVTVWDWTRGGASPILWALLDQLIFTSLGEKFDCIRLVTVHGEEEHVHSGESFVDNTTTGMTNNDDTTIEPVPVAVKELTQSEEDLSGQMQIIIHLFLDLLQVTGGDLAPDKCVWLCICHRWNNRKARLLTVQNSHRGIKITSRSTGTVSIVKRKSPEEGHRTLGFQISGDGKCIAQKKAMKEKIFCLEKQ
jgi:hypothetical protein